MATADRVIQIETALDALYARLTELGVSAGVSYTIDGESYSIEVKEIVESIRMLEDQLIVLQRRTPSRHRLNIRPTR